LAIAGKIINIPDFWICTFWKGVLAGVDASLASLPLLLRGEDGGLEN
jgi:hypothetical protein